MNINFLRLPYGSTDKNNSIEKIGSNPLNTFKTIAIKMYHHVLLETLVSHAIKKK